MEPSNSQTNSVTIPIAIVAGFAMIALAIYITSGRSSSPAPTTTAPSEQTVASGQLRPVDDSDYILGNPNAQIIMVEYSDYDCPFCKQFHDTMHQIMDEYGVTGRVAWVYRQFPIGQLHPNSPKISEAAYCVGDLGGNNAFWTFSNLVFDERDFDVPTNVTKLPEYAEIAGVNREDYVSCMNDRRMQPKVEAAIAEGFDLGIRGTPYTVLQVGNDSATLTGAESYETIKGIIENLLDQLDGNFDPEAAEVNTSAVPAQ